MEVTVSPPSPIHLDKMLDRPYLHCKLNQASISFPGTKMANKPRYKVANWRSYNRSLINRGNITLWISDEVIEGWNHAKPSGKRGRSNIYSDLAIETALTLRNLFRLPLRQTQGLIEGLISLLHLRIDAPNYSTLSRRSGKLKIDLQALTSSKALNLVIDGTGLKVYGEGEWHMRTHGKSKRRTWRKLHVAIDRDTHEIVSITLTPSNVHDSMQTGALLEQLGAVATVTADKAYDNRNAHQPIADKGARAIIPVRSGGALKQKDLTWGDVERNRIVKEMHLLGKNEWKFASGYSRRSLVETGIGRYKKIFGPGLSSRRHDRQVAEVRLRAKILNRMTQLGMPKSYKT